MLTSFTRRVGATGARLARRGDATGHTLERQMATAAAASTTTTTPHTHTAANAAAAAAAASAPTGAAAGAASSPAAAAASASSGPDAAAIAAESRWLYRVILRHVRLMPEEAKRADARDETKRQFRETRQALTSQSDPAAAARALSTAYSKLSFLRMATPKHYHPRVSAIPASYTQARALFGAGGEAEHLYVYLGGEVVPANERSLMRGSGRSMANSQGITDEQIKRHHALVERMHFRGPHWEGKSKY